MKFDKNTAFAVIAFVIVAFMGYRLYAFDQSLALANSRIETLIKQNGELVQELAKAKKDYMELTSKYESKTAIDYVPKSSPDDGDFEVAKEAPKVIVHAGDGNSFEYQPSVNTFQSIENGKVVITEQNTLELDIEKIVDARFKDKIEALEAKHALELKAKDAEIEALKAKLKITKKQRDFYGAAFGTTVAGGIVFGIEKKF